jgi:hypothetical protein
MKEYMKERIYEIRGQRVILDSDLSEIYGYTTKAFNQQVKNNIEKFDEDFMFELTDDEVEDLRSNFLTANLNSKSRYNPHVFTEQGLYMLMIVLKGPLAVKQSKALIRTFKKMKDYILENLMFRRLFVHDNRMFAERAFYCIQKKFLWI